MQKHFKETNSYVGMTMYVKKNRDRCNQQAILLTLPAYISPLIGQELTHGVNCCVARIESLIVVPVYSSVHNTSITVLGLLKKKKKKKN